MTPTQNTNTGNGSPALSSPLVAALEAVWSAIQARHADLPDVVIVLASGSVGAPRGALKLGHFAAMRWTHAEPAQDGRTTTRAALPEVFVGGEGLALGAVDVLGTLLHEATHALAHVRGISDTSRQGRYHNKRFADLAAEVGLEVRQVPVIGWSDTHVNDTTRTEYADTITALTAALTIHRRAEGTVTIPAPGDEQDGQPGGSDGTAAGPGSRNGTAARCGCGRRIRVTASVLALGPITCGLCGQPFTTPDTDLDKPAADAPEEPGHAADDVDTASSASRQHFIDTGHHLAHDGTCRCDH
jgi:hypothetical protein